MRTSFRSLTLATLLSITALARAQSPAPRPEVAPVPQDRVVLPANVVPSHYDLDITPDAKSATFKGTVKIDLEVKSATRSIELNAADLKFSQVQLSGVAQPPDIAYDAARETATLSFPAPVAAGPHTLVISYSGLINPHPAGLFYLDYTSVDGRQRRQRALYTQFENSDARRFLPCWDEPDHKATFTLTATVPAADMALSNTPIDHSEPVAGGRKRVTFGITPQMSTYLLFFGSGDFERVTRTVDAVQIGVVVRRGELAQARFALDAAAEILPFYEDYFGVRFPLPKLDLIGAPGSSQFFSAMENWGAILLFDRVLLVDPKISTQRNRINVYTDVAHEMAHQWFGDLVTMRWWDDLWLNEGFAEWMQYKAMARFHPEWDMWLQAQAEREGAMNVDARAGTHPIIEPIRDVLQANEAFDEITYNKGMSVIRMLEDYTGPDAFRAGVRNYIKAHAYGNTVTDDLWRELDRTSPKPVTAIAHQFTLQAGVPLIRATADPKGLQLTQARFALDDTGRQDTRWDVPVTVQTLDGPPWQGHVNGPTATIAPVAVGATAFVNAGQAGYYRVLYAPAQLAVLTRQFARLKTADQIGLLNDTAALGHAGYQPLPDFLTVAAQVQPGMDPLVLRTATAELADIGLLYEGLPGKAAFGSFARGLLQPWLAHVGWTAVDGESGNTKLLRTSLLQTLGNVFDDPAVITKCRALFRTWLGKPDSLPADLRAPVLNIVAAHADAATWEQLRTLARHTRNPMEQAELHGLLGYARDPKLAQRALDLTLTDEAEVTARPEIISAVSSWHPGLAFDFAVTHLAQVNTWLEPDSRNQFEADLLSGGARHGAGGLPAVLDPAYAARLHAYADTHIDAGARRPVVAAEARIADTAQQRQERLPDIDHWLQHPPR